MNYSFTKRNSRLLAILMVTAILMSLLSGCFGSGNNGETTDGTGEANVPPGLVDVKPTETEETTEPEATIDGNTAVVISDQLSVRSSPSVNAKVIGYLEKGTVVEILLTASSFGVNWARTPSGWVAAEHLEFNYDPEFVESGSEDDPDTTDPSDEEVGTTTSIKGVISATQLYIRKEASASSESVGSYAKGDVVTILETKNGWGRTSQGWISMEYVTTSGDGSNTTNNNNNTTNENNNTTTNTTNIKGVVTANELNIRKEASTNGDRVGAYTYGDRITILETSNGWGRTDKGWVSLTYVYQDGTTGTNTAKGIVSGTQLNVRSGPGTGYDKVSSLTFGDRVNILEQITVGGTTWGCTKSGWISMEYVYVDGTTGEGSGTGVVTGDQVNIRSGPGTGYDKVATVNNNDTLTIYAQFEINGVAWGCTDKGWICMQYVTMG